ncbi:MAG: GNAT family N-acetyltransferase [Candidatus Diapherotrites archaeon]|nr:GNAT family N-acetyltransferase [Candidatus Diapherotrites archaeon]
MIREFKTTDFTQLIKIIAEEFPYKKINQKAYLDKVFKKKLSIFLELEKNKIVAYVEIENLNETTARINAIAVIPEFRRKGLGKKLIKYALQNIEEKGFDYALLLVKTHNEIAKNLYKKFGFEFLQNLDKKVGGKKAEEWIKQITQTKGVS